MGSLSLRPGDSLTVPRTALSVGFIRFVSSTNATQATGLRLFPRWDSPPTEHASLSLVALWSELENTTRIRRSTAPRRRQYLPRCNEEPNLAHPQVFASVAMLAIFTRLADSSIKNSPMNRCSPFGGPDLDTAEVSRHDQISVLPQKFFQVVLRVRSGAG